MKWPSGEKVRPLIPAWCCLQRSRRHQKGEERNQPSPAHPPEPAAPPNSEQPGAGWGLQHAHTSSSPGQTALQTWSRKGQHTSCARIRHGPFPLGASSALHTEAHKGSLFSCSAGQALPCCWPTVHWEVREGSTGCSFTTQSLGTGGSLGLGSQG